MIVNHSFFLTIKKFFGKILPKEVKRLDNLKWAIEFCIQLAKVEQIELDDLINMIKQRWDLNQLMNFIWEE